MSGFAETELTRDAFLGGRLHLWQPRQGYRAGVDPVLLAAAVPARAGQSLLDLGCGAGAAALSLAARVGGLRLVGVELQAAYAHLAERNAAEAGADMQVHCANLTQLPAALRQERFDHVVANPPYFAAGAHSPAMDAGRSTAMGEDATPLEAWVRVAAERLVPKGYLHVVQRVERLPELMQASAGRLGSLEVLPLAARAGRAPGLILLRARKGGRAAFRLHAPLVMHAGAAHGAEGSGYSPEIEEILRSGAPLCWPNGR